jgi:hypothetical protein
VGFYNANHVATRPGRQMTTGTASSGSWRLGAFGGEPTCISPTTFPAAIESRFESSRRSGSCSDSC